MTHSDEGFAPPKRPRGQPGIICSIVRYGPNVTLRPSDRRVQSPGRPPRVYAARGSGGAPYAVVTG